MSDKIKLFKKNSMNRFLIFLVLITFISPIIASDATEQSSKKYISEARNGIIANYSKLSEIITNYSK